MNKLKVPFDQYYKNWKDGVCIETPPTMRQLRTLIRTEWLTIPFHVRLFIEKLMEGK